MITNNLKNLIISRLFKNNDYSVSVVPVPPIEKKNYVICLDKYML